MNIFIITIFPELFRSFIETSLIDKAIKSNEISFDFINPRDFTNDRHRSVDDEPYGGGGGMVMKPGPIVDAYESIDEDIRKDAIVIVPSPRGEKLGQKHLMDFSMMNNIIFVCGRYKDIDQRALEIIGAREFSIGDYIIQGGEIAAMVMIEGFSRLLPGFLGDFDSAESDSFWEKRKLSAPSYTRPRTFRELEVPAVLVSGNHEKIRIWKENHGKKITKKIRPDLID